MAMLTKHAFPILSGIPAAEVIERRTKTQKDGTRAPEYWVHVPALVVPTTGDDKLDAAMLVLLNKARADLLPVVADDLPIDTDFDSSLIGLDAVVESVTAARESKRLNKEAVEQWFLSASNLHAYVADLLKGKPSDVYVKQLSALQSKLVSLAGNTSMTDAEAAKLAKLLNLSGNTTELGDWVVNALHKRLRTIQERKPDESMLADLGL